MSVNSTAPSDASLVRASDDDPRAFGELYERHVDAIYRFFRRRIAWAAADLTAETFAAAWIARRRFRDERGGSALPWLYGIALNVLAESVRRDKVEARARVKLGLPRELVDDDQYDLVERQLSPTHSFQDALLELTPAEREATVLRVVEELPYEAIAEQQGIRPAAARLRVSRALRRLAVETKREDR